MGKLKRLELICDIRLQPATDKCLLSSAYIEPAPRNGTSFILDVTAVHLEASGRLSCVECCYYRPGRSWDLCLCKILLAVCGAKKLFKAETIPILSLLSINAIGEAFDIMTLLRSKMLRLRHGKIVAQFAVVLCLSAASLLSGPIARYSTNLANEIISENVPGFLTTRFHNSILNAPIVWNETSASLERTNFLYD